MNRSGDNRGGDCERQAYAEVAIEKTSDWGTVAKQHQQVITEHRRRQDEWQRNERVDQVASRKTFTCEQPRECGAGNQRDEGGGSGHSEGKPDGEPVDHRSLRHSLSDLLLFVPFVSYNQDQHMKPRVMRYESLPSTNSEVARLAVEGAEEGLAIVADEQTAGRGRLQRSWSSPKGAGLYLSILLRPAITVDRWPLITFVAALAAGDALLETSEVRTDIKWPNDLLANERKICGILAEAIETPAGRAVVVGIGINLTNNAFPQELLGVATSVAQESGRRPEREAILNALLAALVRWYSLLHEPEGAEKIVATWASRSSYASERLVKVTNGAEIVQGITRGVENDGALRLETAQGLQVIRAGDVTSVRPAIINS